MTAIESLVGLIGEPAEQVPIVGFTFNLVLAAILSSILGRLYVRYGRSLSNRQSLSGNFMLITITTMFIIAVVKSSIALSLGLVGALSIVRFRTALKEPEELAYLFLAIAIGLGLGADQTVTTLVAFLFVTIVLAVRDRWREEDNGSHVFFSVQGKQAEGASFDMILGTIKEYCQSVDLKRYDESEDGFEAMLVTDFENVDQLFACNNALRGLNKNIVLKLLDSRV